MEADEDLLMPRPAGMTVERAQKAEIYADYLYMHGAMTIDQLEALAGMGSEETIRRILRDSKYAKSFQHAASLYEDGAWKKINRLKCWKLTTDGKRLVERYIYPGTEEWGYSSGKIKREPRRNTERLIWMNEIVVAATKVGLNPLWMNVAVWLERQGARTNGEMRKLWLERPPMMGVMKVDDRYVGMGLFTKKVSENGLVPLVMNAKRTFPKELDMFRHNFSTILFLPNDLYEASLFTMSKLRYERPALVRLPYEYCLDQPDKLAYVLQGERDGIFQPLLNRLANEGWIVEETGPGEPYRWKARKNGRVEYFDGTFGTPLAHLYNIVLNDTGRFGESEPGERVLYVVNEREAKDVSNVIRKIFKAQRKSPPICRVMDW
ncbi:hypothetical protein LLE49_26295 [Alicyclobacillus tolerans]|uniref:hypothetical protein n=1 Tax=Alicyclobacillus tolerans TaxID=90970 RepID=UPI001F19D31F|nr:hypothetical protein [Alicyclobacillus tolerans]MCF8568237.1 hypothetical protein [Alicyclobacillus tolerans]